MEQTNIYQKLATIRVELQESKLKKSGKNAFANFEYFTLDDFLPTLNNLMKRHQVFSNFSMDTEKAYLTFINNERPDEQIVFTSPIAEAQIKGSTPIQCLGGVHTYMKRYLYLNAFEIVEGDVLDALAGSDKLTGTGAYKPKAQNVIKTPDMKKEIAQPKSVDAIVKHEMTLEEAKALPFKDGTTLDDKNDEQLQRFYATSNNEKYKKAASIILDARVHSYDTDSDFVEEDYNEDELPF